MKCELFTIWAPLHVPDQTLSVNIHREISEKRIEFIPKICNAVVNNLLTEKIQLLDEKRRYPLLLNSLATTSQVRSGDLSEILMTEYITGQNLDLIYIRRLRYKDSAMSMRGDDMLAFYLNKNKQLQVLKIESKAKEKISKAKIQEAVQGLTRNENRPNPTSVAFIIKRLREEDRNREADIVTQVLENEISLERLQHIVFTMSGNNPEKILCEAAKATQSAVPIKFIGLFLSSYMDFISTVYGELINAK